MFITYISCFFRLLNGLVLALDGGTPVEDCRQHKYPQED
jgi:hypothetical protein